MKKSTKLLAGAVAVAIGGLAMTSIANATTTVTLLTGETVNYTLNSGTSTASGFTAGVLQVSDEETTIFILDRNLGATVAGTGSCENSYGTCPSNDPTYGFLFQWGNNYGFPHGTITSVNGQVESSSLVYDPLHQQYYSSGVFYKGNSNWLNDDSVIDLWGGSTGDNTFNINDETWKVSNPEERQGPCPEGFHVPSYGELYKIRMMMGYFSRSIHNDLLLPFAGGRISINAREDFFGQYGSYWSSSPKSEFDSYSKWLGISANSQYNNVSDDCDRAEGLSVRCFYNSYDTYTKSVSYIEPTDIDIQVTVGETVYNELPNTMTVTTNNEQQVENKPVLGEVSVSFGSNESAKFSKLVKVNIPVENAEQVIIKVKHAGLSEYNFDGLTTNVNASCNNGKPTSNQYNGETITVVDGFASIYTCEASDFIALGLENGGDSLITVNIAALNSGQNTCSLDNYIFSGIFASPSVVFKNISQSMHCIFGDAGSKAVTLELSGNLTDGSGNIIPGGNVRLKNSAWIATPSGIQTGNTAIAEYTGLNQTITLFNKVANKIGEATGAGVDIQIEVPGGTPNGVYNGVLVLSY